MKWKAKVTRTQESDTWQPWRRWFAWYPVTDGDTVYWLCYVLRRVTYEMAVTGLFECPRSEPVYEYKALIKTTLDAP